VFRDSRGIVHTVSSADPLADLPAGAVRALQAALLTPPGRGPEGELPVDVGSVLATAEAVRDLLDLWQEEFFAGLPDEVDLAEEARWAAEAGLSLEAVEADHELEDDGLDGDGDDPAVLDPGAVGGADAGDDDLELLDLEDLDDLTDPADLTEDADDDLELLLERRGPLAADDPRRALPEPLVTALERELLLLPVRVRLEALVAAADLVQEWSDLVADEEKLLGHLVLAHGQLPHPGALEHELLAARHAALHAASGPRHARGRSS
jgi:hypothetical protein